MKTPTKMPLQQAQQLAEQLVHELRPYCERIEIAGSIRRQRPTVSDIEIVTVPKFTPQHDLFGDIVSFRNELEYPLNRLAISGARFIKSGPRYKQIALPEGVNLDLFVVLPPAQWGVIFAIRTGPANFSKWIVTQRSWGGALPSVCSVKNGAVWRSGEIVPMPEEIDLLQFLGLGWVEPENRQPNLQLQPTDHHT